MRSFFIAFSLIFLSAGVAQAKVEITVDKDNQAMTVAIDGVERYHWPVSTGIPSRETPSGNFRAFRMEEDHYSKEFDDAPMPHAIFFTKVGHAIHGTDSVGRLGSPASHGCVRLSRANASTLYALVQQQGVLNTTVTLTGSASVAMARNPRGSNVARRGTVPQDQYSAAGDPVDLTPQAQPGRNYMPQNDGYIYPADGTDTGARYPAPRDNRRLYDAQVYQQQQSRQYQSYDPSYGQQGYYYRQPQPYYQPRGGYYYYQN
ncbi:L,D-transpeptidase [Bradyrhizobium manausense]|uniref:L,D-transpeptidase n=1 Tax=Bradyrhizobium TaxID=374 RepID=UPI001BA94D3C|nr:MULTISPECIES: L,D-transpeptidase [Bradyrhizobium]MBR0825883.1 L,D-transpeptidase [Bradyrhizobium manausense]UVO31180.1 L,D-transpeptidase [Bradyrhizobium arachidis]